MHDGLGGYLVSALSMLDNEKLNRSELTTTLEEASEEMRTLIDMVESENNLLLLVGSLREKIERRLKAAKISLIWNIKSLENAVFLDPGTPIQIVRIVQETVANTVKHSGATKMKVTLQDTEKCGYTCLSIEDNGSCFTQSSASGRGIRNLKNRACRIGAGIEFDSRGEMGGMSVHLLLRKSQDADRQRLRDND